MVDDRLAQQLEGEDACFAVGLLLDGVEYSTLVHTGGDVDDIVTWLEHQVWNRQGADFNISNKICEGDVALDSRLA
jgi:hypothetical protein